MLKQEKGFTLIEILTVVVIIVILASALAPRFFGRTEDARVAAAKSDIATMELALDAYEADNGFYPTTEQGFDALLNAPTSPPVPLSWKGPYLKKRVGRDPWGNLYVYLCPGIYNTSGYDIYSYGRDGKEGGTGPDADITNWDTN
jgi:general secretion pathway protein G